MATKKPEAPAYDAEAEYDVKLARPVPLFGQQLLPLHAHRMTGRLLTRIAEENGADVIASATAVR